jgi:hypothetical protein
MGTQIIPLGLLVIGFWLGWKFLPKLINWLQQHPNHTILNSPGIKFILWLTAGSLFTGTLIGVFFQLLYPLAMMLFVPGWCNNQAHYWSMLGNIPGCLYLLPSFLFYLIIFVLVFWFGVPFISEETYKTNKLYIVFLLLTITNLIFQLLYSVFSQFFQLFSII